METNICFWNVLRSICSLSHQSNIQGNIENNIQSSKGLNMHNNVQKVVFSKRSKRSST